MSGDRVGDGINPSAVITGAKVKFKLGTDIVGYASAVNYSINHEMVPVYGLNRLTPYEYAETGYSCSFSVSRYRVPYRAEKPGTGSPVHLGWQADIRQEINLLTQGTIRAEFYDRSNNELAFLVIDEVKMTSRVGSFTARDLATETLDFVGLLAWDESSIGEVAT